MFNPDVVCFCDIPREDLHIHMRKYGRVGLAFKKSFLTAEFGANPVFYVAADAKGRGRRDLGEHFDVMADAFRFFQDKVLFGPNRKAAWEALEMDYDDIRSLCSEMDFNVFAFIKCFDGSSREADDDNYYMEREWRVYGPVKFNMGNVMQVIMPRDFFKPFRAQIPDYHGELIAAPRPRDRP